MPLGNKPECVKCGTRETPLWHSTEAGNLCNACIEEERNSETNPNARNEDEDKGGLLKPTRRSTRITRYCNANKATGPHKVVPKGKGRRNLFKKTVCLLNFSTNRKIMLYVIYIFSQLKRQRQQQHQLPAILCSIKALIFKWVI